MYYSNNHRRNQQRQTAEKAVMYDITARSMKTEWENLGRILAANEQEMIRFAENLHREHNNLHQTEQVKVLYKKVTPEIGATF